MREPLPESNRETACQALHTSREFLWPCPPLPHDSEDPPWHSPCPALWVLAARLSRSWLSHRKCLQRSLMRWPAYLHTNLRTKGVIKRPPPALLDTVGWECSWDAHMAGTSHPWPWTHDWVETPQLLLITGSSRSLLESPQDTGHLIVLIQTGSRCGAAAG